MPEVTHAAPGAQWATLIGDLVGSRTYGRQTELIEDLQRQLDWVNDEVEAAQPLQVTIGDEFQGVYRGPVAALTAGLLVQLRLRSSSAPESLVVRIGVGVGEIAQAAAAAAPFGQSGSAWWNAREAVESVAGTEGKARWPRGLRTGFRSDDAAVDGIVEAFLICRDELVARMDARDARITLGLFMGELQVETAAALGVLQPAISRKQKSKGALAVFRAHEAIGRALA